MSGIAVAVRRAIVGLAAIFLIVSCGGDCLQFGGCKDSAGTGAKSVTNATPLSTANPNIKQQCGVDVGPFVLNSPVLDVHDGDTITVNHAGVIRNVRLDGIDAPELDQPFGDESRLALSNLILNKSVTVSYAKTDQYDRIIGSVFTGDCTHVNLRQVQKGMAWFYVAYQCELSKASRDQFQAAQDAAKAAGLGLWAQDQAQAPWVYRNGTDPGVPECATDLPSWASQTLVPAGGSSSAAVLGGVSCGTKNLCSQMSSCAEARAFFQQCGVSSLDEDKDGIPCEALCK